MKQPKWSTEAPCSFLPAFARHLAAYRPHFRRFQAVSLTRTAMMTDEPKISAWLLGEAQTIRCLARQTTDAKLSVILEELADAFDQAAWASIPNREARWRLLC